VFAWVGSAVRQLAGKVFGFGTFNFLMHRNLKINYGKGLLSTTPPEWLFRLSTSRCSRTAATLPTLADARKCHSLDQFSDSSRFSITMPVSTGQSAARRANSGSVGRGSIDRMSVAASLRHAGEQGSMCLTSQG